MPWVGTNSAATRPSLLVDRNGHLNLSFVDLTSVYYSRSPIKNADSASGWLPKKVMSGSQIAYFSRMALDSKNKIHFVFTQNTPSDECQICYHLFYRASADDGISWTASVDLISGPNGVAKPQMFIDKDDGIHLVWESGKGGGLGQLTNPTTVSYTSSKDGGKTWLSPVVLSTGTNINAKNITIGQDKQGNLIVAWWSRLDDQIVYQLSRDGGSNWSSPTQVPYVMGAAAVYPGNLDDYAMANDSDGNVHLVAVGRLPGSTDTLNIFNLVWDGSGWAKPDVVATYKGDVPEWPRIAVSQGNQLYVTWFVRDQVHIYESDKGQYRVWFSKGYSGSQSVGALPEPVASVTPRITSTQAKTPTSKLAASTTEEAAQTPDQPFTRRAGAIPTSEAELLPIILAAIIPSILLIVGAAVFVYRRNH
jgi:hypothetical protein